MIRPWRVAQQWWTRRSTLGRRGERAARRHLRRRGYRILAANLRSRLGEIDLLVEDRRSGTLVIVEVKTTADDDPGPEVHVNRHKQYKLSTLAADLVRRGGLHDRPVRFDVVGVVWPDGEKHPRRVTHYENAFQSLL